MWRNNKANFDGHQELRASLVPLSGEEILSEVMQLPEITFGKKASKRKQKDLLHN